MTTKHKLFFLLAFVSLTTLSSCVTLYTPNMVNTPMFSNKGQVDLNLGIGKGFNTQIAVAASDHLGLMGNALFINSNNTNSRLHKESFAELGLGYFTKLSEEGAGRFEIYSGIGSGATNDNIGSTSSFEPEASCKYFKFFLQPAIGFTNDYFTTSFALRFSSIAISNINYTNKKTTTGTDETLSLLEPALTLKAGGKYVKPILQIAYSFPLNGSSTGSSSDFLATALFGPIPTIRLGLAINLNKQ